MVLADVFDGDPADMPLAAEQDIAPGKLATDLLINAVARTSGGEARRDWPVEVSVAESLTHGFHVRGPVARDNGGRTSRNRSPNFQSAMPTPMEVFCWNSMAARRLPTSSIQADDRA